MADLSSPLLSIRDLQVTFVTRERTVHAVNGVSFDLQRGEVLSILGESGSGKSVTLRAVQRLLPERRTRITGEIEVDGEDVLAMSGPRLRKLRGGEVSMIFQEPATSFDPVYTIGQQIMEAVVKHMGVDRKQARRRALELLELVRIPSAAQRRRQARDFRPSATIPQRHWRWDQAPRAFWDGAMDGRDAPSVRCRPDNPSSYASRIRDS